MWPTKRKAIKRLIFLVYLVYDTFLESNSDCIWLTLKRAMIICYKNIVTFNVTWYFLLPSTWFSCPLEMKNLIKDLMCMLCNPWFGLPKTERMDLHVECFFQVLFRSPHQGPKVDIWSAGVTLLYLMIGRTPFYGDPEQ